jgi:AAA+ superfamily predicted ATPase
MSSRTAQAILADVRARARVLLLWAEKVWTEGESSRDQGLSITSGEVRRILTEPDAEENRYRKFVAKEGDAVRARAEAEQDLAECSFWKGFTQIFELDQNERDLLCLGIAVELEPKLGRVLAYLADDTQVTHPNQAIAAPLFGWEDPSPSPMKTLVRWRLAQPLNGEATWRRLTPWQVDEAVVLSMVYEQWTDPAIEHTVHLTGAESARSLPCLYPQILLHMKEEFEAAGDRYVEIALTGSDGSGRETLAAQFAAELGRPLLSVKSSSYMTEQLIRAVRIARVTGAVVFWRDSQGISEADWAEVRALTPLSIRGTRNAPPTATHEFVLPPLSLAARVTLWAHYADGAPPQTVLTQRLTAAEVKLASGRGGEAALKLALRRAVPLQGDLLQQLACPYTWDDLVLAPQVRRILEDFEEQVRLRWQVYEEWGFARLTPLGKGISALFGGPSGTGKTMAAQVLARSLELTMYRVDLAGVVNKYIGETEKRLRDVFDACEHAGALLFFDEADALFGNRTQVKDSHDRFANIEIDYLLQRIEQFDGVAILATNRRNDLDTSFQRRLRFVVEFLNPGKPERLVLWQKALPEYAPSGEKIRGNINFQLLADELDVNGAQIKSIAISAAFLARSAGSTIGMEQIELATQREFMKKGLTIQMPFGEGARL